MARLDLQPAKYYELPLLDPELIPQLPNTQKQRQYQAGGWALPYTIRSQESSPDRDLSFPSDLQKLLEMVRGDARRTVTMDNGTPKQLPRYVLWIPGANKGYQNNSGDIPNSSS